MANSISINKVRNIRIRLRLRCCCASIITRSQEIESKQNKPKQIYRAVWNWSSVSSDEAAEKMDGCKVLRMDGCFVFCENSVPTLNFELLVIKMACKGPVIWGKKVILERHSNNFKQRFRKNTLMFVLLNGIVQSFNKL